MLALLATGFLAALSLFALALMLGIHAWHRRFVVAFCQSFQQSLLKLHAVHLERVKALLAWQRDEGCGEDDEEDDIVPFGPVVRAETDPSKWN